MNTLSQLIKDYGFESIDGAKLKVCSCPNCGKKSLGYANHPHAQGYKDKGTISCRSCNKRFKRKGD